MINAPCMDCPDRYIGCHSDCSQYLKYLDEKKKYKTVIGKFEDDRNQIAGYKIAKYERLKR